MGKNTFRIVHYSDVPQGGFAGIVEKQMVVSTRLSSGAANRKEISHGSATANGINVGKGDLMEGGSLELETISKLGLVLIN